MTFVKGMLGLGDNIYQRAFIKQYSNKVYLSTPWPEIYADLPNVKCVLPQTKLRTHLKNIKKQASWESPAPTRNQVEIRYGDLGIVRGMARSFKFWPANFDLPDFGRVIADRPYALIRPVTVRKEWVAQSRNPAPEYVAECATVLREAGYLVVSVADLQEGAEWVVGELPESDIQYHQGELSVTQLMALVKNAAVVVGGVGWIVPAAIAYHTPAWIVMGGNGGFNAPGLITHPTMRLDSIEFVKPDNFCRCKVSVHSCDKRISNHANKFTQWLRGLPNLVAGEGDGVSPSPPDHIREQLLEKLPGS